MAISSIPCHSGSVMVDLTTLIGTIAVDFCIVDVLFPGHKTSLLNFLMSLISRT